MTQIEQNVQIVLNKIELLAEQKHKNPAEITLVAVTKTQSAETINLALKAGVAHFGENKVQEATQKLPSITEAYAGFHFIGHLQTNKVKALLKLQPCLIHSIDSRHLAQAVSDCAFSQNRMQDILLQVNTSGEANKHGIEPSQLISTAEEVSLLTAVRIKGLMTIGRLSEIAEDSRQDFRLLADLFKELRSKQIPNLDMKWLSMGMTNDYEIAIEEGANLVRIGSAIFGARQY